MTTAQKELTRKERKELARKLRAADPGLEIIHPHAAGIDVGNSAHYVAVRPDRDPQAVRRFECFTADLYCRAHICVAHLLLQHWQGTADSASSVARPCRKAWSPTFSWGIARRLRIGWRPYFTQLSRQRRCILLRLGNNSPDGFGRQCCAR